MFRTGLSCASIFGARKGLESEMIRPSLRLTMRLAYSLANSGLWVTMTTRRSLATSFKSSMTWMEVLESKAPVGSSARRMSGLLTKALAIATLCICPPDIWLGFLWACSLSPTSSNACKAISFRCLRERPPMVKASSTLERMVWCGIRL